MTLIFRGALCALALAAAGFSGDSLAQSRAGASPVSNTLELGKYGDWGAYMSGAGASKVCFALSQPKDRVPKGLTRDPAYAFVSTRPGQNVRNEVSFIMGFSMKGAPSAAVDGKAFPLEAKDKSAFVKNPAEEARVLDTLKSGTRLTVKATSARGNDTTDTYSLTGLGKALEKLASDCK